ncbi:MAG TPA: adenylate/guanylate cyclase domain-containing protein [Anaerohalosphaeraceae bacterium]|nr:adenylate/guanylate cyclase domain-containing protein [Anaerohalosphaeraceae bacterium]
MNDIIKGLGDIYDNYITRPSAIRSLGTRQSFAMTESTNIEPLYRTQNIIRPLWGKPGNNKPDIGDHPDFRNLKGTDEKIYCPIVTMFMDIINSTRLGVLYSPDKVQVIKNAIISMAIDIIVSLDGHVHRIMGDAVMAYFGGKYSKTENAVIDAINCSSMIQLFFEKVVIPKLDPHNSTDNLGIRVGLDYGDKDHVLWSSYGYPGACEVTATSFFVDVASKLQQSAGKNNIMIGQSLRDHVDFPEELLSRKTYIQNGETKEQYYVTPNYTDNQGNPINYNQWVLKWKDYLACSNLAQINGQLLLGNGVSPLNLKAEIYDAKEGNRLCDYQPNSCAKQKGNWIHFTVLLPFVPELPATLKFIVENHGKDAQGVQDNDNHTTTIPISSSQYKYTRWESLGYKGLHYMTAEVSNRKGVLLRTRFGVYVE